IVAEDLGRLRHHQLFARQGGANPHVIGAASHLLNRVHGGHGHDGRAGLGRLVEDLVNGGQVDEGADRVVDRHQAEFRPQRAQCVLHRFLAAVAALHHAHAAAIEFLREHFADPYGILAAHGDYDGSDALRGSELAYRVHQDRRAIQQHELLAAGAGLLRGALTHPGAQAGRGQYDGDFHVITILSWFSRSEDSTWAADRSCAPDGRDAPARPQRYARARRICRKSSCRPWSGARWSPKYRWSWRSSSWRCPPP